MTATAFRANPYVRISPPFGAASPTTIEPSFVDVAELHVHAPHRSVLGVGERDQLAVAVRRRPRDLRALQLRREPPAAVVAPDDGQAMLEPVRHPVQAPHRARSRPPSHRRARRTSPRAVRSARASARTASAFIGVVAGTSGDALDLDRVAPRRCSAPIGDDTRGDLAVARLHLTAGARCPAASPRTRRSASPGPRAVVVRCRSTTPANQSRPCPGTPRLPPRPPPRAPCRCRACRDSAPHPHHRVLPVPAARVGRCTP